MAKPQRFDRAQVSRLLDPSSVVIVGASDKPGALGASVLSNLERNGFVGDIHLVNPTRAAIGDRPCIASVEQLPEGVDCAILAIPRPAVVETMRALAKRKAGAAIIFSAGFAEDGDAGLADQQELARIAEDAGMLVEGPNCLGCVNNVTGKALTFVDTRCAPPTGKGIAVVSQSGAMAAVVATTLQSRGLGISYTVSTGNEAVSGIEDYLEWLEQDEVTQAVAMIVEHVRQPQRFLASARKLREAGKQVILLHPGRSAKARASAATHTGAIAGDHAVMRTLSAEAGILLCDTLQELADVTELVHRCPPLVEGGVAVVGESGAFKALTLDLSEQLGLELASLGDADSPALRAALPEFVPVSNPLDITAMGLSQPSIYTNTITALLDDDRVSAVLVGIIQTDDATCHLKFPAIVEAIARRSINKPLIYCGLDEGAEVSEATFDDFREAGIPVFSSNERALRALAILSQAQLPAASVASEIELAGIDQFTGSVPEYQAKRLLAPAGIPFPPGRLATSPDAAADIATELGYPVVLKAQAARLGHKSDAGGVAIGLADEAALREAWAMIYANVSAYDPTIKLDGLLVEAMGERGVEMIVGAKRDPDWGTVMLVGFGGITTELLGDVTLVSPNANAEAIRKAIDGLIQAPLLYGYRGSRRADVSAVIDIVAKLAAVMQANPSIAEIDLNPVIVTEVGAVALDALIELA